MKKTYLVRLTRCFDAPQSCGIEGVLQAYLALVFYLFIVVFMTIFFFPSSSIATTEIPTNISPEMLERAREAVERSQRAAPPEVMKKIMDRSSGVIKKELEKSGVCDEGKACSSRDVLSYGEKEMLYYFFSFSMPAESLKRTLLEALKLQGNRKVVMVLRGFVNNDLRATIEAFGKLMRDSGVKGDLPVEIDPNLYERFNVTEVPLIVFVSDRGTGVVKGDVGLSYALSRFDKKLEHYGKHGHTYPIAEADILKVIAAKQPQIEKMVQERIRKLKKEMYVLKKHNGKYEKAKKDRTYYVDPSVVLAENLVDHQGNILFAKGTSFNPADYIKLGRYIVIDGNDPVQVKHALRGDYRKIMLISGDLAKLTSKHRKRFWFVPDEIMERFSIKRVPTIIEQEGKYIRVTEKAI